MEKTVNINPVFVQFIQMCLESGALFVKNSNWYFS